eukprot:6492405-Pyramimonas_sp.AAC.1
MEIRSLGFFGFPGIGGGAQTVNLHQERGPSASSCNAPCRVVNQLNQISGSHQSRAAVLA